MATGKAHLAAAAVKKNTRKVVKKVRTKVRYTRPTTRKIARAPRYPRVAVTPIVGRDSFDVLRFPVNSEKAMTQMEKLNVITFIVERSATKHSIKRAFESVYKTKVARVNTLIRPDGSKKAFIKLAAGEDALNVSSEKIGLIVTQDLNKIEKSLEDFESIQVEEIGILDKLLIKCRENIKKARIITNDLIVDIRRVKKKKKKSHDLDQKSIEGKISQFEKGLEDVTQDLNKIEKYLEDFESIQVEEIGILDKLLIKCRENIKKARIITNDLIVDIRRVKKKKKKSHDLDQKSIEGKISQFEKGLEDLISYFYFVTKLYQSFLEKKKRSALGLEEDRKSIITVTQALQNTADILVEENARTTIAMNQLLGSQDTLKHAADTQDGMGDTINSAGKEVERLRKQAIIERLIVYCFIFIFVLTATYVTARRLKRVGLGFFDIFSKIFSPIKWLYNWVRKHRQGKIDL
ncbi:putative multi-domain containing protein [Aduncisulcus paluster]|uniref:Multi-domain containing protein n=1 Tax=Aduncisulcus paluster TaxID=2918883 RepID=A0ABQ5K1L6_9EUKA|nr:putative multi-domain containing protein [Aduncisulcus paluster]